jgi:ankyrin repeat protein
LEAGANVMYENYIGYTALTYAAGARCNLATFEMLFLSGANKTINLTGSYNWSALLLACEQRCEFGVIQLLLQQGANISQVDEYKRNALMLYVDNPGK